MGVTEDEIACIVCAVDLRSVERGMRGIRRATSSEDSTRRESIVSSLASCARRPD